jgi:ATP-dependent Clp protease adaptor protein ClpS
MLNTMIRFEMSGPDKGANGTPDDGNGDGMERGVATKTREKTKKPSMYRVLLMNDDYTPMEFVISILMGIFKKSQEEATQVMLNVHQTGIGTCGVYTFEVAETKVAQVMDAAKRNMHPLQCTLEKD